MKIIKQGNLFFDKNKNKINSEDSIDIGDVGIFYASMVHGVDKVSLSKNSEDQLLGRWWVGLYSPESDHNKDRKTSNPYQI